jgi:hypothetical protein
VATQQRTSAEPEATPSRLPDLVRAHLDLVLYAVFGVLTTLVNIVSYWAFAHVLGLGLLRGAGEAPSLAQPGPSPGQ